MRLLKLFGLYSVAFASMLLLSAVAFGDTIIDPLHGYCSVGCVDNNTNSPTTQNPITGFGFTISPGPASGNPFVIDILVPNNENFVSSYAITGTNTGTATLFSATPWTSGFLDAYLGISSSSAQPIGAYLPSTVVLDPGATGFFVYTASFAGPITLLGASNPNVNPLDSITGGVPLASYIVGFLNEGSATEPNWISTANSGAIFETSKGTPPCPNCGPQGSPVPEPSSLILLGTGLLGLTAWSRKRTAK